MKLLLLMKRLILLKEMNPEGKRKARGHQDMNKAKGKILKGTKKIRFLNLTGIKDLLNPSLSTTAAALHHTEVNMISRAR